MCAKNKKRVLFIMSDLRGGGAEKSLTELLKGFDYDLYDVTLCLLFDRGIYLNELPHEVKVIKLFESESTWAYRKACRRYRKYGDLRWLAWLIRVRLWQKYDAVVSYMEGLPLLFHNLIRSRGKRNISWVHCDLFAYHYTERCFRTECEEAEYYKRMDELVFVSKEAMMNFYKLYPIETKGCYLYNAINLEKVRALSVIATEQVKKQNIVLIAIGSLFTVKGFDRLLRVVKMLKDEGLSVGAWILGKGQEEDNLKSLRDELGLQEEVEFLGFRRPVYPYVAQADILVSTSVSEGLSYVICEAFTLGVPVVATKTAGAMELLENGAYGILTEHDDRSLYEALKRMIADKELRHSYAEKGKKRAEMFDTPYIVQQVCNLIETK